MKELVCRLLIYSGLFSLWRYFHRNRIIILMVHGVGDMDSSASWLPLWKRHGEKQLDTAMSVLSKKYNFISMDDAVAMLCGDKPMVQYSMVMTFDDGYRDSVTRAMPILRKYGAPGIIYLATDYIEKREPYWVDRIDYALQKAVAADKIIEINGEVLDLGGLSHDEASQLYKRLRLLFKSINDDSDFIDEMNQLAQYLEGQAECSLSSVFESDYWAALLTWEEVKTYAKSSDISFGSHTVGHFRLALVDSDESKYELEQSKRVLEKKLAQECVHFCYPAGSYNEGVVQQAHAAGYQSAVTCTIGLNAMGSNLAALSRYNFTTSTSVAQILIEMSGMYDLVSKAVSYVRK